MSSTRSTQYNDLVESYSSLYNTPPSVKARIYPSALIEEAQLKSALLPPIVPKTNTNTSEPYIRGAHILDLATGTGNYARLYLKWGAASVSAVDISPGMIDEARLESSRQAIPESKLSYHIGDVTDPTLHITCPHTPNGKFDIVTSAWLLNYSPDVPTMKAMFDTISRHLKTSGWSINLTCPPLSPATGDPPRDAETLHTEATLLTAALTAPHGAMTKYGTYGHVISEIPDGLKTCIRLGTLDRPVDDPGFASFENFYMRRNVHDEAVRQNGAFEDDELEWLETVVPEVLKEMMRGLGRGRGYLNEAVLQPLCRVCVARRR